MKRRTTQYAAAALLLFPLGLNPGNLFESNFFEKSSPTEQPPVSTEQTPALPAQTPDSPVQAQFVCCVRDAVGICWCYSWDRCQTCSDGQPLPKPKPKT